MRPVATLLALLTIALLTIAHIRGPQPQAAPRARPRATPILPLSVEATRQTDLHAAPGRKGRFVGTLARGTRVPILGEARGGQCKGGRWLEVSRGAWMCADHGRLTWRFPRGAPQPLVREGSLVPRRAYYARRDGVPVYLSPEAAEAGGHDRLVERGFSFTILRGLRVGRRAFIQTRRGELVPRGDLFLYQPSSFVGQRLTGRPPSTLACSIAHKQAVLRSRPSASAPAVGALPYHRWVTVHESVGRGKQRFHRVGDGQWVHSSALGLFHFSDPPAGIGPSQRWVEVLLRHQTLVAYEGSNPVYATLVSTGRWDHRTPQGLYRARTKVAMSTMSNRAGAGELYSVEDVPWIFFYHEGYAIHGTYWHNGFGVPKSKGCINLSPLDARWLFDWAPPQLPRGWAALESTKDKPGLLIRVRNHTGVSVDYRGPSDQNPASPSLASH